MCRLLKLETIKHIYQLHIRQNGGVPQGTVLKLNVFFIQGVSKIRVLILTSGRIR
jgi:hypothetical protein